MNNAINMLVSYFVQYLKTAEDKVPAFAHDIFASTCKCTMGISRIRKGTLYGMMKTEEEEDKDTKEKIRNGRRIWNQVKCKQSTKPFPT